MTVKILIGDVFARLGELPNDSVDCVVTSPPYWGLRDYGVAGQIGLEPTLGDHLDVMVRVFREVRRVLKPTGSLWLNYGDCYATSPNGRSAADTKAGGNDDRTFRDKPFSTIQGTLKPKDLCMVPNRLAIALQDDGWWVRSEIIWHKPNPMPESIKDRPGNSHEKVWLLSKSSKYFYDHISVQERVADSQLGRVREDSVGGASWKARGQHSAGGIYKRAKESQALARPPGSNPHTGLSAFEAANAGQYETRNLRNVWTIPIAGFSEAHFATFPPELAERCIKAGCPAGGTVLDPFGGAGTTGLVADRLGRSAILIELNPEYAAIAERRIRQDNPLFTDVASEQAPVKREIGSVP